MSPLKLISQIEPLELLLSLLLIGKHKGLGYKIFYNIPPNILQQIHIVNRSEINLDNPTGSYLLSKSIPIFTPSNALVSLGKGHFFDWKETLLKSLLETV